MVTLSKNNHFKYGYDRQWFVPRATPAQNWTVEYGPCTRPPKNFLEECILTAKQIFADANQKIVILYSGGVDSEVVVQSFLKAKVPFEVAISRFKDGLNEHDIKYAIEFCDNNNIQYKVHELDLIQFWEKELYNYADPTRCVSPQLLSTMWLVDQVEGFPVLGSGECLLVKDKDESYIPGVSPYLPSSWSLWEKEKIASWYRHFQIRGRDGCPGFFQYTPEIILSYLVDPYVQKLTNNEIHGKLTTESSKLKIYQQHFDLKDRPKYTGFELVQDQDAHFRKILRQRFPDSDQISTITVDELSKKLQPLLDHLEFNQAQSNHDRH